MPEDQAETVHLSPQTQQEYIRNGRIFRAHSEHKLWTMKRSRIIPALKGQEKNEGKGTGKEVEWDLQLWGDLKRGESPHPGKLFTGGGAQLRQKRSLILCGKRTQQQSVAAGQCETCTQATDPCPALPTQSERVSTTADKGWVLECGVWRADQGSGLLWVLCEEPSCRKGREGGAL